jgi:hypothetical protein
MIPKQHVHLFLCRVLRADKVQVAYPYSAAPHKLRSTRPNPVLHTRSFRSCAVLYLTRCAGIAPTELKKFSSCDTGLSALSAGLSIPIANETAGVTQKSISLALPL